MPSVQLLEALAVTAELMGNVLTPAAARVLADDLSAYPEEQVLAALRKCRKEVRSRLTVADVIARLEDGRPGPEEAWGLLPRDEYASVVMTEEMREAWAAASALIREGSVVPARLAFVEKYRAAVQTARERGQPPKWTPSLGLDPHGRESALRDAVEKRRISVDYARALLPHVEIPDPAVAALANDSVKRLA